MTGQSIPLEDFSMPARPKASVVPMGGEDLELLLAKARRIAHDRGVQAGREAAEREFDREMTALLAAIETALDAAKEDVRRAEEGVRCGAAKLFRQFIDAAAPRLAEEALVHEVGAAVEEAIARAPRSMIFVEVAADRLEETKALLSERFGDVEVRGNSQLSSHEARVRWEDGFDRIDPQEAMTQARRVLDAHLDAVKDAAAAPQSQVETFSNDRNDER